MYYRNWNKPFILVINFVNRFFSLYFQVKIWFQNRRMKWRNSKERELLSTKDAVSLQDGESPNPVNELLRQTADSDADDACDVTMSSRTERLDSYDETVSDSECERTHVQSADALAYPGQISRVTDADVIDYHNDVTDSFSESDEEIHVS